MLIWSRQCTVLQEKKTYLLILMPQNTVVQVKWLHILLVILYDNSFMSLRLSVVTANSCFTHWFWPQWTSSDFLTPGPLSPCFLLTHWDLQASHLPVFCRSWENLFLYWLQLRAETAKLSPFGFFRHVLFSSFTQHSASRQSCACFTDPGLGCLII